VGSLTYESDSHLHGDVIAEHSFPLEYDSLIGLIGALEIPLRDAGPFRDTGRPLSPKRHVRSIGGLKKPFLLPVDQGALNGAIKKQLRAEGWSTEPVASGGLVAGDERLGLRGDFARGKVFVEVEFGNAASFFRDLFKFQVANRAQKGDVGVLLVATDKFARFFDSGVTTFEGAQRAKPYMAIGLQMPVWIIGIEPLSFDSIGARYAEMWEVCQANGVDCHDFNSVMTSDDASAEVPAEENYEGPEA
jgi:hypothetical protein